MAVYNEVLDEPPDMFDKVLLQVNTEDESVVSNPEALQIVLGHMWIMLGTYVNIELANRLTKHTLLVIG